MKENDWIIANLNNPQYSPGDLRTLGLNLDNTQILLKEDYLKSDYIKNNKAFQNEEGVFSEKKFDDFYKQSLQSFQTFSEIDTPLQYDMFDYRRYRTDNANVKDPKLRMFQISNPQEFTIGDGWINEINESQLSNRERAQKNEVYDHATGQYLQYTPNEHSLTNNPIEWFKDIFKEPLVLAKYDQEGTHTDPFTGKEIKHAKGDLRINDQGKYFYETLDGRSLAGQDVLSGFDTLTIDGEGLNRIDFFDSDGKDKSIGGTLMKGVAAIAPLFLPTPLATAYSATLVLRELGKSLPMIDGLFGAITDNNQDTAFTRLANNVAGKMTAATSSTSDYSRDNQLSLENLSNLLVDVALQWGQQKVIAQSIAKLKGTQNLASEAEKAAFNTWKKESVRQRALLQGQNIADDIIEARIGTEATWKASNLGQGLLTNAMVGVSNTVEKYNRLGADTSLLYMALVSNTDVYQSMLEAGCTKREAMSVALGSMLGMFSVDKYLGLGEMFFDEFSEETGEKAIRNAIKKEIDKWANPLKEIAKSSDKGDKTALSVLKSKNFLTDKYETFFSALKNHSLTALGKAVGEGMEEVSEELCADMSKQIYEWAAQWKPTDTLFGDLTTENVGAFDNAFDNPLWLQQMTARYGMNFLGGVMGGGLFYGVERWKKRNEPKRDTTQDNLVYAIRNNGKDAVLNMLEEYKNLGKLGSTKHSINYEVVNGEKVWLTPSDKNMSQNDFVYNQLKYEILGIDKIINDNEVAKTDEELKQQLTLGDARFVKLLEVLDENADYTKGYINRYQNLITKLTAVESKIKNLRESVSDNNRHDELINEDIAKLEKKKALLQEQLQQFNSGENAIDYMGKILFEMDDNLNSPFYVSNFRSWLKNISDDTSNPHYITTIEEFDRLNSSEKQALVDKYMEYKNSGNQEKDGEQAWAAFKDMQEVVSPELVNLQDQVKMYEGYLEKINGLFSEDSPFSKVKKYTADDITEDAQDEMLRLDLDDRTYDEDNDDVLYESRNVQLENESDEQFVERLEERKKQLKLRKAKELTKQSYLQALEEVQDIIEKAGGMLDSTTKRHLLSMLEVRQKDIVQNIAFATRLDRISKNSSKRIKSIIEELKEDLSNADEIERRIQETVVQEDTNVVLSEIKDVMEARHQLIQFSKMYGRDAGWTKPIDITVIEDQLIEESEHRENLYNTLNEKGVLTAGQLDEEKLDTVIQKQALWHALNQNILTQKQIDNNASEVETYLEQLESNQVLKSQILTQLFGNYASYFEENYNYDLLKEKLTQFNPNDVLNSKQKQSVFKTLNSYDHIEKMLVFDPSGKIDWVATQDKYEVYKDFELSTLSDYDDISVDYDDEGPGVYQLFKESEALSNHQQSIADAVREKFQFTKGQIETDEVYSYIQKIKNYTPVENPVIRIIKKLGMSLNRDTKNVEELLERMSTLLHSQSREDFTLKPEEKAALQEADDLLALAQSFLWSTYNSKTFQYPYPHNQLINSVIKEHGLDLSELPVIDDSVAGQYWKSIQSLRLEIGQTANNETGFTIGSYRYWDAKNAVNKSQKLTKAAELSTKAKLFLLEDSKIGNRSIFTGQIVVDDQTIDINLLEGISEIQDSDIDVRLYKIETLFYNNVQRLLNQYPDLTLQDIFEGTSINDLISDTELLREQTVASADENLTLEKYTPMDKAMYFITLAGLSPQEFYAFQNQFKNNHNSLAPLDVQGSLSRSAMMYLKSPNLYRSGIDWMFKHSGFSEEERFKLYGLFIPGNGGGGKTDVIVRSIAEYGKDANILLAGPTSTQEESLKELNIGSTAIVDNIVKKILGEEKYIECTNDASDESRWGNSTMDFVKIGNVKTPVINKNVNINNINTGMILIDEATHVDTWKLSVLSRYAEKFNIPLILVGDNFQQGKQTGIRQTNLNCEVVFCGRTQRIAITLRDANVQKYENIKKSTELIAALTEVPLPDPNDPNGLIKRQNLLNQAINQFKDFKINYYSRNELNGDIIVDNLKEELLDKINVSGKIAYLGNNSGTLDLLKSKFGDKVVQFTSETNIQGQEFDHIIVDVNWEKIDTTISPKNNYEAVAYNLGNFMRRFYTLSTRGKISAVFIDQNGQLQKMITQQEDDFQNTVTNFGEQAKANFRQHFEEKINKFDIPDSVSPYYIPVQNQTNNTSSSTTTTTSSTSTSPSTSTSVTGSASLSEGSVTANRESSSGLIYSQNEPSGRFSLDDSDTTPEEIFNAGVLNVNNEARVYSAASFAGMIREDAIETVNGVQKNIHHYRALKNPNLRQDLEIFSEGKDITSVEEVKRISRELLKFKSAILYGHTRMSSLPESAQKLISKEDYQKILSGENIKLVVSKRNKATDNFIGLSGLDSEKMEIGKEQLVYKVVAEFNIAGTNTKGRLTLGLLANPETFAQNKDKIIKRLENYIEEEVNDKKVHSQEDITRAREYINSLKTDNNIDNRISQYRNYIKKLEKEYLIFKQANSDQDEYIINLPGKLKFSRTTSLRTIQAGEFPTQKIRFDDGKYTDSPYTFKSIYKDDLVMSDVYIYKPDKAISDEIRTLSGKPVVFVSRDLSLNPASLRARWEQERTTKQHSVRALILDNLGVSLSALCNKNNKELYRTLLKDKTNYNKLPFENREMGIRMLTSLWNWRANLLTFQHYWGKYLDNNEILRIFIQNNPNGLDQILVEMHDIYQKLDIGKNKNNKFKDRQHPTNEEYENAVITAFGKDSEKSKIAQAIFNFNNIYIDSRCKQFRLGAGRSVQNNGQISDYNGWIIRKLNLSNDSLYLKDSSDNKNKDIYGIYLTPNTLNRMINMTEELCTQLFGPKENPYYTLIDPLTNKPFGEMATITMRGKNPGYLQTIYENGININVRREPGANLESVDNIGDVSNLLIKAIPLNLVKIAQRSIAYGKTVTRNGIDVLVNDATHDTGTDLEKEQGYREWNMDAAKKINVKYTEVNADKTKGERKNLIEMNVEKLIRFGKTSSKSEMSLIKMLELCFHGTTEEFTETQLYGKKHIRPDGTEVNYGSHFVPQATDANFKYGFFSDPMGEIDYADRGKNGIWMRSTTKGAMYATRTRVDFPYLYFDFSGNTQEQSHEVQQIEVETVAEYDWKTDFYSRESAEIESDLNNNKALGDYPALKVIVQDYLKIEDDNSEFNKLQYNYDPEDNRIIVIQETDEFRKTLIIYKDKDPEIEIIDKSNDEYNYIKLESQIEQLFDEVIYTSEHRIQLLGWTGSEKFDKKFINNLNELEENFENIVPEEELEIYDQLITDIRNILDICKI